MKSEEHHICFHAGNNERNLNNPSSHKHFCLIPPRKAWTNFYLITNRTESSEPLLLTRFYYLNLLPSSSSYVPILVFKVWQKKKKMIYSLPTNKKQKLHNSMNIQLKSIPIGLSMHGMLFCCCFVVASSLASNWSAFKQPEIFPHFSFNKQAQISHLGGN